MIVVSVICLLSALFLFLKEFYWLKKAPAPRLKESKKQPRIALLIPARDESQVIEQLLISIEKQSVKIEPQDVYIIVEDKQDKTVAIAANHHMRIIYRRDLSKKRKGYAIEDALLKIKEEKQHYDLYFMFDADNYLAPTFIEEMLKPYHKGYDIAIGYRNCKNGNDSVIAAVSSLTFSMINTLSNVLKYKFHQTLTISGTGFFIRGDRMESFSGYPFHSLTEDYELTLYASLHQLSTAYQTSAIFYDEQPTSYKQTVTQRTRWIRGYFTCRKKYVPLLKQSYQQNKDVRGLQYIPIVGVKPFLFLVLSFLLILGRQFLALASQPFTDVIFYLVLCLSFLYVMLWLVTFVMLKKEKKTLNLNRRQKRKALFFNPLFLASYVICLVKAFSKKEIGWDKITHQSKFSIK